MVYLKKLSSNDGEDVFNMLKGIKRKEFFFTNPTYDMSFDEFKQWLIVQEKWSAGRSLPEGFVPQTVFWLYDGNDPIGIGKIRKELTESSKKAGGNIGYAISSCYRNKGYGKQLLGLLLIEARKMDMNKILLTVAKTNDPSIYICLQNGGVLIGQSRDYYYYEFS